jgi:7-carboxy-7-deazaguanine synthase
VAGRLAPLKGLGAREILLHESFISLQGESTHQGRVCLFLRTTGCHLRCRYCDTPQAFTQGTRVGVEEVVGQAVASGVPLVEVTGGEPLLQRGVPELLRRLCDRGLTVLLETSGAVSTRHVDPRVRVILDVKTPGSGEVERNVWATLGQLKPHDEVKFVLTSEEDYRFAVEVVRREGLDRRCAVLFSPVTGLLPAATLAGWVVRDRLPVRFQLQLHRVLWGDRPGV